MFASLIAKIALLAHKRRTGFGSYPPQFWTSLYVVRPQERVFHLNAHSFSAAVFVAAKDKNAAVDIPVFGYICLLLLLLLLVLAIPGLLSPAEILPEINLFLKWRGRFFARYWQMRFRFLCWTVRMGGRRVGRSAGP